MSLVCSISGYPPEEPVLGPSGFIYERRLIEKEIELNGKCPVSGVEINKEQLVNINTSKVVKPRPLTASSIPGLLSLFQNEWDALMHETFLLRMQLDKVRSQLSQSLYQHDAATRVIARIVRERDAARLKVSQLQQQTASGGPRDYSLATNENSTEAAGVLPQLPEKEPGLSVQLVTAMQERSRELLAARKKRHIDGVIKPRTMKSMRCVGEHPLHSSTIRGCRTVDIDPKKPQHVIVSGGMDGSVVIFNLEQKKTIAKLLGHTKAINCVKAHPTQDVVLSCSDDKTTRVWTKADESANFSSAHVIRKHTGEVLDLSLHPLDNYFVSSSKDKSWAFYEIDSGRCLRSSKDLACEYRCLSFHPDGMIVAGGGSDGGVHIWDLKSAEFRAALSGHDKAVTGMSFSQNGYYMATASEDGTVRLWDLRKSLSFQTITANNDLPANNVEFDFSGQYLAVCSVSLSIYNFETRVSVANVVTLEGNTEPVTDAKFGPLGFYIVSSSFDRVVRHWEPNLIDAESAPQ